MTIVSAVFTAFQVMRISHVTDFPGPFVDWRTYENAFSRVVSGGSIYAAQQTAGPYHLTDMLLVGYAYPPASVPFFAIFQGYPFGLAAWLTLNLGLLFTALWAICTRGFGQWRVVAFSVVLVGLMVFDPFIDGVIAANVNVGLGGIVGWVALGIAPRVGGLLGGLGAVLKVFAGAAALAVPERKLASVVMAGAVAVALSLLTLPLVGIQAWIDFVHVLVGAVPDCYERNSSIACALGPVIGLPAGSIVGIAVGGIAAATMIVVRQPLAMAVLLGIAIMAPANNLHPHYWIIPFVLLVAAVGHVARLRRDIASPVTSKGTGVDDLRAPR